ncbi:MAG: hypothetical protein HUJ25_04090 [Crocinitomicaceae bacterium]|nr:hypothetical protein [Crocinitomicaceae bacterium]
MSTDKKSKKGKRILLGFMLVLLALLVTYMMLPAKTRNDIMNEVGGEGIENTEGKELKEYISVQGVISRQAVVGDDWVIKGKLFNQHDSLDVSEIKLMFNFSDGVETVTLEEEIRAGNIVGRKFKERISGHGDAEFESVEVLEAK